MNEKITNEIKQEAEQWQLKIMELIRAKNNMPKVIKMVKGFDDAAASLEAEAKKLVIFMEKIKNG